MSDTTAIRGGTDPIAWGRPLQSGIETQPAPYQRFQFGELSTKFTPLARGDHVAMYVTCFAPGEGEVRLHAHDDEAIWLVLEGEATFYGEGDRLLGCLGPHEGVLIPTDTLYRYVNSGASQLIMVRSAGRAQAIDAAAVLAAREERLRREGALQS